MTDEPRHDHKHDNKHDRRDRAEHSPPSGHTGGSGITRDQRGQDQPKDKKTAQRGGSIRSRT